jgi:hypothetical protein
MLRAWQRLHGNDIVAEVAPVDGMGTWRAWARHAHGGAWHNAEQSSFAMLVDAQAAADRLAIEKFNHLCDQRCAEWRPHPEAPNG